MSVLPTYYMLVVCLKNPEHGRTRTKTTKPCSKCLTAKLLNFNEAKCTTKVLKGKCMNGTKKSLPYHPLSADPLALRFPVFGTVTGSVVYTKA